MNSWLDIVVTAISWSVVAQHIWATRGHFVSDKMQWPAALLAALVLLTSILYTIIIWTDQQPLAAKLLGLLLELVAMALFWWAIRASRQAQLRFAFDPNHPRTLLQGGPYRYVRHPFYTSYILFWTGWAVATFSPLAIPTLAVIIVLYILAARGEERRFAGTAMSRDYEAPGQGRSVLAALVPVERWRQSRVTRAADRTAAPGAYQDVAIYLASVNSSSP